MSLSIPLILVHPFDEPADLAKDVTIRHILIPLDGTRSPSKYFGQL